MGIIKQDDDKNYTIIKEKLQDQIKNEYKLHSKICQFFNFEAFYKEIDLFPNHVRILGIKERSRGFPIDLNEVVNRIESQRSSSRSFDEMAVEIARWAVKNQYSHESIESLFKKTLEHMKKYNQRE